MRTRISDNTLDAYCKTGTFDASAINKMDLIYDLMDARQEVERLKESLLCIAVLPNSTTRSIADYSDIAIKALNPIYANIGKV